MAVFGIPKFEQELLEQIFALSESRKNGYRIVVGARNQAADLALVDRRNATAAAEFERFQTDRQDIPTLVIANGDVPQEDHWVRRPVSPARVLGALDELVECRLSAGARSRPRPRNGASAFAAGGSRSIPSPRRAQSQEDAGEPNHPDAWRSGMSSPGPQRRSVTKRDILNLLCKRKSQILAVPLVALFLVAVGSYALPRTYEAYATVYVKRNLPPVPGLTSTAYQMVLDRREVLNSEVELINSRVVAEKAAAILSNREFTPSEIEAEEEETSLVGIAKSALEAVRSAIRASLVSLGLLDAPDPHDKLIEDLRKKVKAKPSLNSNVVTVSFRYRDPEIAAYVVNTVLEVYLEKRLDLLKRPGVYAFYTDQLAQSQQRISALEEKVQALKDSKNTVSFDEEIKLKLSQLGEQELSLSRVRTENAELGTRVLTIRRQLVNQDGQVKKMRVLGRNPRIDQLTQNLMALRIERSQALARQSPDSREVRTLDETIARVQNQLASEPETVLQQESVANNDIRQSLETKLYEVEAEFAAKTVREKLLVEQIAQLKAELVELDRHAATINELNKEIENANRAHIRYMEQADDARVAEATTATTTNVRVVHFASPPSAPLRSRLTLILAGLAVGLFMGLALAFISEFLDHTLNNAEDVETQLGLPLLASLPDSSHLRRKLRLR